MKPLAVLAAFFLALVSCNKEVPQPDPNTACNNCSDSGPYTDPNPAPYQDPYSYTGDPGDNGNYGSDNGSNDGSNDGSNNGNNDGNNDGSGDGSDDGGDDSGGRYHVHRQHAAPGTITAAAYIGSDHIRAAHPISR